MKHHEHGYHQPPCDAVPPMCPPPSPVPPPIPPVRYIPGMNVQEQLCNMASIVNESINRWNTIQADCYKALDNMVGAAVNNDVYYAPDEVKLSAGYSSDDSCPYHIIEIRCVDKAGKPIFMHLKAAYNNETNTGTKQPIEDVSFISSANAIITAYNPAAKQWHGTVLFNGNPGEAGEVVEGEWICGWNRNGVLRVFPSDTDITVLKQNRMVNCIGPVIPIIEEGEITYQATNFTATRGSIQAIGWKKCNGNKVMFSCTNEDQPGMSVLSVAKVLQKMGVTTAAVTCYQSTYAQPPVIPPIQPENNEQNISTYGLDPEQQGALGLTGGMLYIGQITDSPLSWQMPQNGAFWVVSKKPEKMQWPNRFTSEIADVCQKLGFTANELSSIQGKLDLQVADILLLQQKVEQNTADIAQHEQEITSLQTRMTNAETRITTAEADIADLRSGLSAETQARIAEDAKLQAAISAETAARTAADTALDTKITQETAARTAEDTALNTRVDGLQKSLQEEQQTRNDADQNLMNAIQNEVLARQTADTALDTKIEGVSAEITKQVTVINNAITAEQEARENADSELTKQITAVSDAVTAEQEARENADNAIEDKLQPATADTLGLVKIGNNITVTADGTISATGGGGSGEGKPVVAGTGITVTETETEYTVSADTSTMPDATETVKGVVTVGDNIDVTDGKISVPVASPTQLGVVRVGNNLSVDSNGVMSVVDATGQPITSGEVVEAGYGIDVVHNEEAKSATVSVKTNDTLVLLKPSNEISVDIGVVTAGVKQSIEDLDDKVDAVTDSLTSEITELKNEIEGNGEIEGLKPKVEALEQAVNGSPEADPPVPGILDQLTDLETKFNGTPEEPGLDARVGELENTAIKDVSGEDGIVSTTEDKTVILRLAEDIRVTALNIVGEDGVPYVLYVSNDGKLWIQEGEGGEAVPATIRNVATPTDDTDAANKQYVDQAVSEAEGTSVKGSTNISVTQDGQVATIALKPDISLSANDPSISLLTPDYDLPLFTIGVEKSTTSTSPYIYMRPSTGQNLDLKLGYNDYSEPTITVPYGLSIVGGPLMGPSSDTITTAYLNKETAQKLFVALNTASILKANLTIENATITLTANNTLTSLNNKICSSLAGSSHIVNIGKPSANGVPYIGFATKTSSSAENNRCRLGGVANPIYNDEAVNLEYLNTQYTGLIAAVRTINNNGSDNFLLPSNLNKLVFITISPGPSLFGAIGSGTSIITRVMRASDIPTTPHELCVFGSTAFYVSISRGSSVCTISPSGGQITVGYFVL